MTPTSGPWAGYKTVTTNSFECRSINIPVRDSWRPDRCPEEYRQEFHLPNPRSEKIQGYVDTGRPQTSGDPPRTVSGCYTSSLLGTKDLLLPGGPDRESRTDDTLRGSLNFFIGQTRGGIRFTLTLETPISDHYPYIKLKDLIKFTSVLSVVHRILFPEDPLLCTGRRGGFPSVFPISLLVCSVIKEVKSYRFGQQLFYVFYGKTNKGINLGIQF